MNNYLNEVKLTRKNFMMFLYQPVKFEHELICRFSKSDVEPRIFHQNVKEKNSYNRKIIIYP